MADVIDFGTKTLRVPVCDMEVYKRAYHASLAVHKLTLDFPAFVQNDIADELRMATRAICMHLIEGFEKQKQGSASFYVEVSLLSSVALDIARKVDFLLCYARDCGYLEAGACEQWRQEYAAIVEALYEIQEAS